MDSKLSTKSVIKEDPATEKQISLISELLHEVNMPEVDSPPWNEKKELSKRDASQYIDYLKEVKKSTGEPIPKAPTKINYAVFGMCWKMAFREIAEDGKAPSKCSIRMISTTRKLYRLHTKAVQKLETEIQTEVEK